MPDYSVNRKSVTASYYLRIQFIQEFSNGAKIDIRHKVNKFNKVFILKEIYVIWINLAKA